MWQTDTPYNTMKDCYDAYFTLNSLQIGIEEKFMLIGLVVYVTEKAKEQKPDVNYYKMVYQLSKSCMLPPDFIKGFSIVCEDFSKHTTNFTNFGVDKDKIIPTIQEYFKKYLPF